MKKINVLVFPCGSEIGLELHRCLATSSHINLIGANSNNDHGRFLYENYIGGVPFSTDPGFIDALKEIIKTHNIDVVYPAYEGVITLLSNKAEELGCTIICPNNKAVNICTSKETTYDFFQGSALSLPAVYDSVADVKEEDYPVFIKPKIGFGSRGVKKAMDAQQAIAHLIDYPESLICEYLPYEEYTVDCFTDKNGVIRFLGPRVRGRVMNGISVNTWPVTGNIDEFYEMGEIISQKLAMQGAWFFQVKRNKKQRLVLMEIACRFAGSSSVHRVIGINFGILSLFDKLGHDVQVIHNKVPVEMDRALDNRYKISIDFNTAYIDLDDCLIINEKVNTDLVKLLYQFINDNKKTILITKHKLEISHTLNKYKLFNIFDEIIVLKSTDEKADYMTEKSAIFIDDSFGERMKVMDRLHIPVFAPDAVEGLMK